MITRLEDAAEDYNKQFDLIMNLLIDQVSMNFDDHCQCAVTSCLCVCVCMKGDAANDFVKHLTFRLDFNEYHSARARAALAR